jgi:hypothetical protein
MSKIVQARQPLKVCDLPNGQITGALVDVTEGGERRSRVFIFKDKHGITTSIYGCNGIKYRLDRGDIGKCFTVKFLREIPLPGNKREFEVEVINHQEI